MFTTFDAASQKLSTCRPLECQFAHNRGMNDAHTADGLGRFLTLADTAELLSISTRQASALVRSGELPAIKVGASGQWRIERTILEDYIEAKYEETRRMNLWQQADLAGLAELPFGGPPQR